MNKLIYICCFLFITLNNFSQAEVINGVSINAPNGFVRSDLMGDEYFWVKFNKYQNASDYILVSYLEVNETDLRKGEENCKKGTRTTKFIKYEDFWIKKTNIGVCYQLGDNDFLQGQFMIERNGITYIVFCNTYAGKDLKYKSDEYENPFENIEYMIGYMATRIKTY